MAKIRHIVHEVLQQLGDSRDAQYYLSKFSSVDALRFAVVKVGGGVINEQVDALAASLAFLTHLGLFPIVLHGAGPQLDKALQEAGVPVNKQQGMRVTSEEVLSHVRPVIYRENRRLVDALQKQGIQATGIQHGVFECNYMDKARLGLVGCVDKVDLEPISHAIEHRILPVVASLGETHAGQVLNLNADLAARALVQETRPYKVIFLTPTGGLLDEHGQVISAISLANDYEALMAVPWVNSGMRLKLQQIKELLDELPASASVSITSVRNLTRELFTHRGAGTLVSQGERILSYASINDELRLRLKQIVESAFSRRLKANYFKTLQTREILVSQSGGAAAIISCGVMGQSYLDKFAVTREAQGAGLGAAIWQGLTQKHQGLYWRSRINNPVNRWYQQIADVSVRQGQWLTFSYGITDFQVLEQCYQHAMQQPESWQEVA